MIRKKESYSLLDALSSSSSSCICSRYSLLLQTTNVSSGGSGTESEKIKYHIISQFYVNNISHVLITSKRIRYRKMLNRVKDLSSNS